MSYEPTNSNCIVDVLKFINELQDVVDNTCPTGCDIPFLGANSASPLCNTRPILLFTQAGTEFLPASSMTIPVTPQVAPGGIALPAVSFYVPSPFLRVESVDDTCAVLRVLVPNTEDMAIISGEVNGLVSLGVSGEALRQATVGTLVSLYSRGEIGLAGTNFCFTVDLTHFCAVQCLKDAAVRGI